MPKIKLPDGAIKEFDAPVSVAEVAAAIGPGLAKAALAGKVDGKVVDRKNQDYPPHGSLPARVMNKHGKSVPRYKSDQIFKIVGTSYAAKGGKTVQQFFIKCRLA